MQSSIYHQLKNTTVRDLYWLLFSSSPLHQDYNLYPFKLFPQSTLKEWQAQSNAYFLSLDKHPVAIEDFVNRKKNKRLGFYAEALLSYFFQTFPEVDLLLQNFQVIENQKTIGEIDFVIQYQHQIIHLECAVKYYLLKDEKHKNKADFWVGPQLKDNLGLKLDKMINHQLPLGKRKKIQEKINQTIDESYLFLKGIFFAENNIQEGKINQFSPNDFIRLSQLKHFDFNVVRVLNRPDWLSSTYPTRNFYETDFIAINKELFTPQLALFSDGKSRFIVPDDWGR